MVSRLADERGFTLVELVALVFVVVLLAVIALPALAELRDGDGAGRGTPTTAKTAPGAKAPASPR